MANPAQRGRACSFWILVGVFTASPVWSAEGPGVSLREAAVAVDVGESSFVHFTVSELRQQIKTLTGSAPTLYYDLTEARAGAGPVVVVGKAMTEEFARQNGRGPEISDSDPGTQGFILESLRLPGDKQVIIAAGSDSMGTNYAVMQLRQLLAESPSGLEVSASLNVRARPQFKLRGLYLHQHWRYNHPYATWGWSVEDWKRALDMAAYMRVNLVMLWPHMDMIAPPLSVPEQDYLADIKEVVDYAHRKRGIRMWMVEGPNVLLDSAEVKRLPLERRDYYAYAHMAGGGLKNPADPRQFAALMGNREALYRAVPNADGYSLIDSDPGGWLGSPSSEFVDLFVGNRKLLDRHHERPQEAALVYWLLASWGNGTAEENWHDAMRGFKERVSGPQEFLVCWAPHLKLAKDLGVLEKSVFFPYGIIEGEPTFPLTGINFRAIRSALEYASKSPGLEGTMANSQTFLAQLPNIYHFTRFGWSDEVRSTDSLETLRSFARLLFPERADLLAQAWAQLVVPGSDAALAAASRIEDILKGGRAGRPGTVGSYVFPESTQVLRDLVTMLRIHASAEGVRERVAAAPPKADTVAALEGYLREMLDWQKKTGFFGAYGVNQQIVYDRFMHGPDYLTVKAALERYAPDPAGRDQLQAAVLKKLLDGRYTERIVRAFAGQLFGTSTVKMGEIEKKIFLKLPPGEQRAPWSRP